MKHFGLIEFEPREKMCDSIYLQKTAIFDKLFRIIINNSSKVYHHSN